MENKRLISGLQWLPLFGPLILMGIAVNDVVQVWLQRWQHPYDLEWMEGGMLTHAYRIVQGQTLYQEPTLEFIPFIYPPGYPALLAQLSSWSSLNYTLGRSVSLLAIISAAAALLAFVVRYRAQWMGGWFAGLLGASLFLLSYPDSGAFFDLVRPDSLALGLTTWALFFGVSERKREVALGGLLLVFAFFVKHHSAVFGLPILFALATRDGWPRARWFTLWSVGPALLGLIWLQVTTDGYLMTYLVSVPATHGVKWVRILPGIPMELGAAFPVSSLLSAVGLALLLCLRWTRGGGAAFLLLMGLGGVAAASPLWIAPVRGLKSGTSWETSAGFASIAIAIGVVVYWFAQVPKRKRLNWRWVFGLSCMGVVGVMASWMRGHHGGYVNVYMPLHWCVSLACSVVICHGLTWAKDGEGTRWFAPILASGLAFGGLAHGWSSLSPGMLVPTAMDVAAGDEWVERLEQREGPVFAPHAPWLPVQAGHAPSVHLIALSDVDDQAHRSSPFPGIRLQFEEAVASGHWPTIVDTRDSFRFGAKKHYVVQKNATYQGSEFFPKTGWRKRPEVLRGPKREGGAKPIQLPTWGVDAAIASAESLRTIRLISGKLWSESNIQPISDLDAYLGAEATKGIRVQADRQESVVTLQRLLVHCARHRMKVVYLDVLTPSGRKSIEVPSMPEPYSGAWIRVILGPEAFDLVHPKTGERVAVAPVERSTFDDKTIALVPVLPISGTVQEAINAYASVWSLGWHTAYWAFQWPEEIQTVPDSAETIREFWTAMETPEAPIPDTP